MEDDDTMNPDPYEEDVDEETRQNMIDPFWIGTIGLTATKFFDARSRRPDRGVPRFARRASRASSRGDAPAPPGGRVLRCRGSRAL